MTLALLGPEATLVIDEGRYAGAEIDVLLNVEYRKLRAFDAILADWQAAEDASDAEAEAYGRLCAWFDEQALVKWNLTWSDGTPITNAAAAPSPLVIHVLSLWRRSVGAVSPPLPQGSPSTSENSTSTASDSSAGTSPAGPTTPDDPSIP